MPPGSEFQARALHVHHREDVIVTAAQRGGFGGIEAAREVGLACIDGGSGPKAEADRDAPEVLDGVEEFRSLLVRPGREDVVPQAPLRDAYAEQRLRA
jgi:hypothetical protein